LTATEFNRAIDQWIEDVQQVSFIRICAKPSSTSWSLGQVGVHLLDATNYFFEQATRCLSTDEQATGEMKWNARVMFQNNEFPDEMIEGPASNQETPQPESKEKLLDGLLQLKAEINKVDKLISTSSSKGKTKHPGLNYFNAREWFQFAYMHFRHHERQKRRIETYLKETSW